MKIVYLIHSLHNAGGMEKILTSKVNWLSTQPSTEVYVITSHQRGREIFFKLNPDVHLLDAGVNDRVFGHCYRRRLQSFLDEIRPDVTVSTCGLDLFHLSKCRISGARLAEYHFLHEKLFLKYPHHPILAAIRTSRFEKALDRYDAVVVLSRYDLDYYRRKLSHPERIHQIGNVIQAPSAPLSELSARRFICVGRLSPEKNFADAVLIWKKVVERYPDWKLDIYGSGSGRDRLQTLIHNEGLDGKVTLCGASRSVGEEYRNSSGVLVTSRYEGFSLVVMESASYGVPVVAYACPGGLVELVNDGTDGFLVKPGDVQSASDCISKLIGDARLRREMGRCAYGKSGNNLMDPIMHRWMELFEKITSGK